VNREWRISTELLNLRIDKGALGFAGIFGLGAFYAAAFRDAVLAAGIFTVFCLVALAASMKLPKQQDLVIAES
jgi:hypothetical protein